MTEVCWSINPNDDVLDLDASDSHHALPADGSRSRRVSLSSAARGKRQRPLRGVKASLDPAIAGF